MKRFISVLLCALTVMTVASCAVRRNPLMKNAVKAYAVSNSQKVTRDAILSDTTKTSLTAAAARNEYEGMQLILRSEEAFTVSGVTISDLTCGESIIEAKDIEVFKQHYINIDKTFSEIPTGYYPDALIPIKYVSSIAVGKDENCGLWFTVHTTGQAAGVYTGIVSVALANDESIEVPVEFTVWDVTLPEKYNARTIVYAQWVSGDRQKLYYDFLQKYRICNSNCGVNFNNLEQYLRDIEPYATDPKVTSISIAGFSANISADRTTVTFNDSFVKIVDALRERGWLDKFFIYPIDEPNDLTLVKAYYAAAKKQTPGLFCVVPYTGEIPDDCLDEITGFCIKPDAVNEEQIKYEHSIGGYLWWYNCNFPTYPSPSLHINDYSAAVRLTGWMQKDYNLDGFLYWGSTIPRKYAQGEDNIFRWSNADRDIWTDAYCCDEWPAGDGMFVYQGHIGDGIINEETPIPSIRIEMMRDGFEDYEVLLMLEQKYKDIAATLGVEIDIDEVMDKYYSSLYNTSISYFTSADRIDLMRETIFRDLTAERDFIAYTSKTGDAVERKVTVLAESGKAVSINGETVEETVQGVYSAIVKIDESNTANAFTVAVGDETEILYVCPESVLVKETLVDFESEQVIEAIEEVSTNMSDKGFTTVSEEGLVATIGGDAVTRFTIPTKALSITDWSGGYTHIRIVMENVTDTESSPMTLTLQSQLSRTRLQIPSLKACEKLTVDLPIDTEDLAAGLVVMTKLIITPDESTESTLKFSSFELLTKETEG